MFEGLRNIHQWNMGLWAMDYCEIERWDGDTQAWGVVAYDVPCSVQSGVSPESTSDEDLARVDDRNNIRVYVLDGQDIIVGDRVLWESGEWIVNAVYGVRGLSWGRAAVCSMPQTALRAEPIIFRRRTAGGTWTEMGPFLIRFTKRPSIAVGSYGSTDGEPMAEGASQRAEMIGTAVTSVLQVGDWFGRDGLPGRVTRKDDGNPNFIQFEYVMESVVP